MATHSIILAWRIPGTEAGLGRSPGEGNGYTLWPGEFHGQRSLAGYSPWGRRELNMADQLSLSIAIND